MTPDRRTLLGAGLSVAAAPTSGADGPAAPASCEAPPVEGRFSCDPDVRAGAAEDFGRLRRVMPRAVLQPASGADIASSIPWLRDRGLKAAARGQGHSTYGRSLTEGVVIDMRTIATIREIQPDRVAVEAGATWGSVLDAALAQGLTPPVLTNYLGLSVGGTIAVGGIGGTSSRYGMQTDHVIELNVVTGDGRELTCSATSNPGLFDAVRAGLGQCGIVTRATLRLVRAPRRVRRFQLLYRDLRSLAADQLLALAEDRFDQLQGAILPDGAGGWRYQLEGALHHDGGTAPDDGRLLAGLSDDRGAAVVTDLTYRDDAQAFARLENLLRSNGQWLHPHPWLLTFLPGSKAEELAGEIVGTLTGEEVGPFGRVTFYPIRTGAFRTPLVRLPEEGIVFPFNIIRIPAWSDAARSAQAVAQNRALYERIRRAGGVLYPVSAFPMSREDWAAHFGPRWAALAEARRRHDPDGLLTPGYELS